MKKLYIVNNPLLVCEIDGPGEVHGVMESEDSTYLIMVNRDDEGNINRKYYLVESIQEVP